MSNTITDSELFNHNKSSAAPPSFTNIINDVPAAIYTCDADGYITFYNQAAVELWGQRPEIGKDLWCGSWKVFHPDGRTMELRDCPMAQTLRERRPISDQEIIIQRPDGVMLNILPHPKPLFDETGNLTGAFNLMVDITDKKNDQALLYEHQRYFKMVEEVENYAIILLSTEGNIINWNLGARKIKGYTDSEIIGKNFSVFYTPKDQQDGLPQRLISQAGREGKAFHEGWRVRKDGTQFWGNILITALHDKDNNIIGYSKVTRDLTEKKLADDKLNDYARDIEFRNRQLEEYAYVASHDLQEPLRKIRLFTDMLKNNLDDPTAVNHSISKIEASASRMTQLITDVLQYSQLSIADDLYQDTNLNEIVSSIVEDLDLMIEERNAVIHCSELPTIPAVPVQMRQLFYNIINNALKFCDVQPIINITTEPISPDNLNFNAPKNKKYFLIRITDNGVGFDEKYADQVFKLFHRAQSNKQGTGIGLALCKKIVENHHGHISASSGIDQGTTFEIILPAKLSKTLI